MWDSSVWKSGGQQAQWSTGQGPWSPQPTGRVAGGGPQRRAGQIYRFRRRSVWSSEEELILGDTRVGSVRKTSFSRGDVAIELPGFPTALQLLVFGVVISMWDAQAAAAGG